MKKFLLLFLLFGPVVLQAQTKRALIIAIGSYPNPEKNGWPQISSEHDVPLVETALEKQDFKRSNIWTLIDAQATRAGIDKIFDKLIDSAKAGDIVVIHISSHGQQIEDDQVDEEEDGLDECIVPYGAVYSANKTLFNQYSSGYFRDDAFGEKITRLRNKLGGKGDILVSIDACHSGSGTRGPATMKARGGNSPMVSGEFEKRKRALKDTKSVFKEATTTALSKDAATYVVISGAQAQEKNYECLDDQGNTSGSLSYALSTVLSTLGSKITYRALFSQIEDVMREKAPQQKPVLEGDGIDRNLFGGKVEIQKPYLPLDLPNSSADTIYVNSGSIAGVTLGSTVGFYPSGTTSPVGLDPIVKGKVVSATNFKAAIKLDKPMETFLQKAPWAFVLEMSYGGQDIKVSVDSLDASVAKRIKDALKDYTTANFTSNCEVYFGKSDDGRGWSLRYANTGVVFDDVDINDPVKVKNLLKRYDRYRYLKDLKMNEDNLSADVQLVFLDTKKNIDYKKIAERTKLGRLELQEGDTVYLRIKNTGDKKLFINIVDMQPDGIINRIMPNRTLKDAKGLPRPLTPESCYVEKGDSMINKDMMITIAPPYGEEIFKVFLSTSQLDLEEILAGNTDENSKSRGVLNNLAKVFESSNKTGSRGANPQVGAQDGTIFGVNFSIVKRQ